MIEQDNTEVGSVKPKKRNNLIWAAVALVVLLIVLFLYFSFSSSATKEAETEKSFVGGTFAKIGLTASRLKDSLGGFFFGIEPEPVEVQPGIDPEKNDPETQNPLTPFPPPAPDGTSTTIRDSVNPSAVENRGTFIVNTHLRANGNLMISGSSQLIDLIASEIMASSLGISGTTNLSELSISGTTRMLAMLEALGGIRTGGANIDLEGGQIVGLDYISSIQAGDNVVISGTPTHPIISVPNIGRTSSGGGSSGVRTLNGQSGEVNLLAGSDIAINGLSIANISTLESVRARGGCVGCLLDSDVADDLTIYGGTINNTIIGANAPATAYFTNVFIGNGGPNELSVVGGATFSGSVRGAPATALDEFVTLGQLDAATGGGATGGVASLNSLLGHVTLAGTAGQINVSSSGSTITLSLPQDISVTASPTFVSLALTGELVVTGDADFLGIVRGASFQSSDATTRKSGEEILRSSVSVFPYALPAETGQTNFVRVSKTFTSAFDNPINSVAPAIAGATREHRLVIKYSDSVPTTDLTLWRIIDPNTSTVLHTFNTTGLNRSDLENPEVYISNPVTIPSGGWQIEVSVPSGRVRVADIHILTFDVIN